MKVLGNFLLSIFGIGSIAISLYKLIIDSDENWGINKTLYGILFGILLIWTSLASNKKTFVEEFLEKEEYQIPLWWQRILGFIINLHLRKNNPPTARLHLVVSPRQY